MIDISRKTYEKDQTETIVDNNEILWLNEKQIEWRTYIWSQNNFYRRIVRNWSNYGLQDNISS